jgi:hypothetical protein
VVVVAETDEECDSATLNAITAAAKIALSDVPHTLVLIAAEGMQEDYLHDEVGTNFCRKFAECSLNVP